MADFLKLVETVANGKKKHLNFEGGMSFFRGEIHMIKVIGDQPAIFVSQIARHFNITRAVVSKTLIKLEKSGFITKQEDPADRKRLCLFLTEKGQKAYRVHHEFHLKNDRHMYEFLDKLEKADLDTIQNFMEMANQMVSRHF